MPQAPREPARSEDCLYLNVWTSAKGASDRRPVMVWIYGGGFTGGSGGQAWYDGENLASKGPVIVTLNYRLGALGFLAHPELAKEAGHPGSGNYGMMDAIAALQWVKRNIGAFGGDPEQRHRGRRVGGRDHGRSAGRVSAGQGPVQPRDRPERRLDGADDGPDAASATPKRPASKALEAMGVTSIARVAGEGRSRQLTGLPPVRAC